MSDFPQHSGRDNDDPVDPADLNDEEFAIWASDVLASLPEPEPGLIAATKALWDLRVLGEAVADLVADSAERPLAGVRRRQAPSRDLVYLSGQCEISVRIETVGAPRGGAKRYSIIGQALGVDATRVELIDANGRHELPLAGGNRFDAVLERGPFRVAVATATTVVTTDWIRLS